MYSFIDTTGTPTDERLLPSEAVSINGKYLEDVVTGYRTLYAKGRESLGVKIDSHSVGVADGERVKGLRYPERTITVGFQLVADSNEAFRDAFNQINNILSLDEADFVFNDEPDKFFTGVPVFNANVSQGRNAVTGEWEIYCGYPFKRSIEPVTVSSLDSGEPGTSSVTFNIDYKGTLPARPILRAKFAAAKKNGDYSEDGDCGFVAFLDGDENIIQLGNPDVVDIDEYAKNGTIVNSEFSALTAWTASNVASAQITDTYWNYGKGQTQRYAKPSGTGSLKRSTEGAVNFEFDIVHRLCVSAASQTGAFECLAKNGDTTVVGFAIRKTGNGTTGVVSYILNGKVVGADSIDLSYYNTHFGYCNRTAVYTTQTYKQAVVTYVKVKKKKKKKATTKKVVTYVTKTRQVQSGWNYTQSNLNSGWSKEGSVITFSIGNLPDRTYKCSDIEFTPAKDIVFNFSGSFHTNAVHSCAMVGKAVTFAEIPNVFTAGDIVEADCNDANVWLYREGSLDGHLEPQYGALGNDWEDFEIKPGRNTIRAAWSGWVNTSYKPTIEIVFNEVYL